MSARALATALLSAACPASAPASVTLSSSMSYAASGSPIRSSVYAAKAAAVRMSKSQKVCAPRRASSIRSVISPNDVSTDCATRAMILCSCRRTPHHPEHTQKATRRSPSGKVRAHTSTHCAATMYRPFRDTTRLAVTRRVPAGRRGARPTPPTPGHEPGSSRRRVGGAADQSARGTRRRLP